MYDCEVEGEAQLENTGGNPKHTVFKAVGLVGTTQRTRTDRNEEV